MPSRGAAYDFFERAFQGVLREVPNDFAVGLSILEVAGGDTERVVLSFINTGTTTIALKTSPDVSLTSGILLGPGGGSLTLSVDEDALLSAIAWYAVGDAAAGTLFVLGVRRETMLQGG